MTNIEAIVRYLTDNYEVAYGNEGESKGHEWLRFPDGTLDIFGYESGHHNGPKCVKCGYGFCHHCHKVPEIECPK